MDLFLLCLPWMVVGLFAALFVRLPPRLPGARSMGERGKAEGVERNGASVGAGKAEPGLGGANQGALDGAQWPLVSVIVPARDEEENIEACVSSLAASAYPAFEIIVVDDGSRDRTAEIVRGLSPGHARRIHLLHGEPLPEGWFGKPWACHQGALQARGDVVLFTDADTVHHPTLLAQAVRSLLEEDAHALTVVGRQVMVTFWEKLLQPQFFMLLAFRFPRVGVPRGQGRWRHAIANGQYILFHRRVYDALGGHRAVAGEVVEDMRLAQLLALGGWKLVVRSGEGLRTRMYRSLGGLVEGWSKNISTGAFQTTPGWLLPFILPLSLGAGAILFLLPPVALAWALATGTGGVFLLWAGLATGFGVLFWGLASWVMKGNPLFGLIFPIGNVMSGFITVKSWLRGGHIQWKGRAYRMSSQERRGEPGAAKKTPDPERETS
jgi:chlorobactene glucosyltransferase